MTFVTQPSYLPSVHTSINKSKFTITLNPRTYHYQSKTIKISPFALPINESSSESPESGDKPVPDRIRLAFERAKEYKKLKQENQIMKVNENPLGKLPDIDSGDKFKGIIENPLAKSPELFSANVTSENFSEGGEGGEKEMPDSFMNAMEKAKEYKTDTGMADNNASNDQSEQSGGDVGGVKDEIPDAVRMAFEKAKEYRKNKGTIGGSSSSVGSSNPTGLVGGKSMSVPDESVTRKSDKKEELKVSSLDFLGLDFGNKKSRRLPAGLVPVEDPFPDDIEVEIIVGDASKFATAPPPETKAVTEEESDDLYKPKVSTWGLFPRPSNISRAFGGGRTIRPGEVLETPEARSAKEARTRELIAAYTGKKKPKIDPKLKAECEKALKDGDALMDRGRLKEALPFFQQVMDKMAFTTELHGLAALQWSICQDSLCRPDKARSMYDKLKSHPNAQVSRKARHFAFSFQAIELMKVRSSTISPETTGYQNYFEAFVEDKKNVTSGETEAGKDSLDQALPYVLFLASPIFLILFMAAAKRGI